MNKKLTIGDIVKILPGQHLGKTPTKIDIAATILEKYDWSWAGLSGLLVRCKPQSKPFMINPKHSKILPSHSKISGG